MAPHLVPGLLLWRNSLRQVPCLAEARAPLQKASFSKKGNSGTGEIWGAEELSVEALEAQGRPGVGVLRDRQARRLYLLRSLVGVSSTSGKIPCRSGIARCFRPAIAETRSRTMPQRNARRKAIMQKSAMAMPAEELPHTMAHLPTEAAPPAKSVSHGSQAWANFKPNTSFGRPMATPIRSMRKTLQKKLPVERREMSNTDVYASCDMCVQVSLPFSYSLILLAGGAEGLWRSFA